MDKEVIISLYLSQDIYNLINKAKHPHFESEIVEKVKNDLLIAIRKSTEEKIDQNNNE